MELYASFSDVMHFFKRNWVKFLLVILLFGVVCGLLPLKLAKYTYTTNSTLTINCQLPGNASTDFREQYTGILYNRVQSVLVQSNSNSLVEKTTQRLGLKKGEISKITGEQMRSAPAVKLTVQTTNADMAAKIADTAADILGEEVVQRFPSPKLSAFISDRAVLVVSHSKKSAMIKSGILGLAFGFIVFLCYGLIRVLSNHSIRSGKGSAELVGAKCLGEIPHGDGRKQADAFRELRTVLLNQTKTSRSLLIEDTGKDSGAPQTAAGLAVSLAQAGRRVLAVDADLRSPQMADLLGVKPAQNLRDVLIGRSTLAEAAEAVPDHDGLFLLAGASGKDDPADLLARSFPAVLKEAETQYDSVIICAPSQPDYPDADSISAFPQAVLCTAKYGQTSFSTARSAVSASADVGGKVAGFVVVGA